MHILGAFSLVLLATSVLAHKIAEDKKIEENVNSKTSKHQELEALTAAAETSDDKEVKRAKKSTTTTFCVEIRPSGPFQKPFQVCEPAEPAKTAPAAASQSYSASSATAYYPSASSYATQEQSKSESTYSSGAAYKPPSQPKAGAVYSAPAKTYTQHTTQAPKTYSHDMSYNSYRSKGEEQESGHLMRMTHASAEEDASNLGMFYDQQLRSTNYGYGAPSYGSASHSVSYVPVVPKKQVVKQYHNSHNGLVITCQPNLAGYAHNVPSSVHHPPAMPYSYRSISPTVSTSRYGRYQMSSHDYGSYQQPAQTKAAVNSYKSTPPMQQYGSQQPRTPAAPSKPAAPVQQYGYAAPPPMYGPPPQAPPPSVPSYGPPPSSYAPPPTYAHSPPAAPVYAPHPQAAPAAPQSYPQYQQSYSPPPPAPAAYAPSGYQPAPVAPSAAPAAPTYTSAPAQASSAPSQSYTTSSGTYRESEDEHRVQAAPTTAASLQENKEEHTLKQMEEMSQQRSSNSQWITEMSQNKFKSDGNEKVESIQKGWSPNMRAIEKSEDDKNDKMKPNEAENELK